MPIIRIDTTLRIPGEAGQYIPLVDDEKKPITLRFFCFQALLNADSTQKASGDDKFHRAYLAQRLHEAKEQIDLEAKDVDLLKNVIGESQSAWVTLVCRQLLELKPQPGDPVPVEAVTEPTVEVQEAK